MSLRDDIHQEQLKAMKDRNEGKLSTLRLLSSAIKNIEIEKHHDLDDVEVVEVVARQVKQLRDALKDFMTGGRTDLVDRTNEEIALLESYLPKQLTDDELKTIIEKVLSDNSITEAKDLGKATGLVMKEVKGKTDGNKVKEILTSLLK